jgi:hypothetical protein
MRQSTVAVPAGTLLYHGTGWAFDPDEIMAPTWFSRSIHVARHFSRRSEGGKSRILGYRTGAEIVLPLIRGAGQFDAFCERHGIRPYSAEDMADGVRRAGLAGWVIPDNYPDGDDILLVDLSTLAFQHEET